MTFLFTSGRHCLDLVATSRYRNRLEPTEHFESPDAVKSWMVASGIVTVEPRVTDTDLERVQHLREVIYRVMIARLADARPSDEDIASLNEVAARPPVMFRLCTDGDVRRSGSMTQIRSSLARDALDLLGSDGQNQLRECEAPDCTRLYIDNTRGSRRRWCSATGCGNRAKVAAYRSRTAKPQS